MTYSIIQADLKKNKQDILALWKKNFQGVPEERYSWIYENNPSGPATCLLAINSKENSFVGATALFPRRILINPPSPPFSKVNPPFPPFGKGGMGGLSMGKYLMAGIAGDFVVDKNHRGLGPALSLQKFAISYCNETSMKHNPSSPSKSPLHPPLLKGDVGGLQKSGKGGLSDGIKFDILYGFPNKQSELVLRRAGYKVLGDIVRMTRPLRSYYYFKKHIDIPIATKVVSKSVDLATKILSKENYYKNSDEYICEILSSFDERFDELWEKVMNQFPIIGERSSSYLNWRFIHSPHKKHNIFAFTKKDSGNILGYIVFNIVENGTNIDDILSLDMGNTLDSLLSQFLLFQRKEGIDSVSISYTGNQFLVKKLQEFGFSIRDRESKIVVYSPPDSPFIPYLSDEGNWYLLAGDNDV